MTILLFIASACSISALPQKTKAIIKNGWAVTDSIVIQHNQFNVDPFDAFYIVSDDALIKYKNHQEIFRFSNSRFGSLTSVDVSNPLATVCYYSDYQVISILDRTLNPLTKIDLADWGYQNVTAVCQSGNNELWIYDASAMQLFLISKDRRTPVRTFPINLAKDENFTITKMRVKDGYLYCLSEKGNLYKLSLIGSRLQELIGNEQIVDFQFSNNRLLLLNRKGQVFHFKSLLELNQIELPFLIDADKAWYLDGERFIYGDGEVVWFYELG